MGSTTTRLAEDLFESTANWRRSFASSLEKSKVGTTAKEMLDQMYEPLWKRTQAKGTKDIQQIFGQLPESLHSDVTKHISNSVPHSNPNVNNAITALRGHYFNQRVTKPLEVDRNRQFASETLRWLDWNQKHAKKFARESVFGEKDEILTSIIKQANKERGHIYANNVADGFSIYFREAGGGEGINWRRQAGKGVGAVPDLKARSPYNETKDIERKLRQSFSWGFTPRIFIPHLTQVLNSVLYNGLGHTAKAIGSIMADRATMYDDVLRSGAFEDEVFFGLEDTIRKRNAGPIGKLLLGMKQPFFKDVRQFQMIISGVGGKYAASEYARNLVIGKDPEAAKVALKSFGLDWQEVLKNGGHLSPEQEEKAMFNAVKETMFVRTGQHTPPSWDRSAATRLTSMYKHYAFSEGRLVSDVLKRSWRMGPTHFAKTLAVVGVMFPAAGEMTKVLLNVTTGHDPTATPESTKIGKSFGVPDEVEDYLDAMGHVAGFGIGYGMMRSAKRRALSDFLVGPVIGTGTDMIQDMANGNYGEFVKDISRKAGFFGPLITNTLAPPKKEKGQRGSNSYGTYGKY